MHKTNSINYLKEPYIAIKVDNIYLILSKPLFNNNLMESTFFSDANIFAPLQFIELSKKVAFFLCDCHHLKNNNNLFFIKCKIIVSVEQLFVIEIPK